MFVKQDCEVRDATCACRLVLWESLVNTIKVGKSYNIDNISVRVCNSKKYLSSNDNTLLTEVDNIGDVSETSVETNHQNEINGEIIEVVSSDSYSCCISCKAKVSPVANSIIGQCHKRGMKQQIQRCPNSSTANALLSNLDDQTKTTVTIFSEMIKKITNDIVSDDPPDVKLLSSGSIFLL